MKRLASTLPNMLLSLTLITLVSGALLGYVYQITKEPIAEMATAAQKAAISDVAPAFNNNPEAEKWTWTDEGLSYTVYPARMDGKLVGAAVKTLSMEGFAGEIDVMVGFNADGSIRNYRVLKHAETPGLGSKMELWFRDPTGARSIIDRNPADYNLYVSKDKAQHGQVDAITAATISSRAFLGSVRKAYEAYNAYKEKEEK